MTMRNQVDRTIVGLENLFGNLVAGVVMKLPVHARNGTDR